MTIELSQVEPLIIGLAIMALVGIMSSLALYSMLRESERWNRERHRIIMDLTKKLRAQEDRADWWRN